MTSPLRVLIVEDSQDDAQLMLRELRRGGYDPISERVETAEQMQAALKQQDWEVILCDYALPGFSAPKALELLTETGLDIPFMVVSGKIGEQTAVEMMRAGADDYVMKDHLIRLGAAVKRELAEAHNRHEHKRAQEAIQNLAKFPGENPGPVLRVSGDGNIIFANKAARPLLDAWSCRVDQALPKRWAELVASVLVSGAREDVEIDCGGRIFLVTFAPVVEAGYVNLYAHDITERKRMEDERRLQSEITANMSDGVYLIRARDGLIVYTNPKFEEMFGYGPGEMLGKQVSIVNALGEKTPEETAAEIMAFLDKHGYWRGEVNNIKKDGTPFWCYASVSMFDHPEHGRVQVSAHTDITDRKRADEAVKRSREELRALAARLQAAREEERTLLARKIHDDVGHSLAAIKMDVAWLNRRLPKAADAPRTPKVRERLESMSKLLAETIQTARETASELRPGLLDDVGLAAAIEWEAKQFRRRTGTKCTFTDTARQMELDHEQSTALFRICQELLTNVASHAGATAVRIALKRQGDELILEVGDNGKGIRKKQISSCRSLGIVGMRERALVLGGAFSISGRAGKGTTATVQIPLGQAAQTKGQ